MTHCTKDLMLRKIRNKVTQVHAVTVAQRLKDRLDVPEPTDDMESNRLDESLLLRLVQRIESKSTLRTSRHEKQMEEPRIAE